MDKTKPKTHIIFSHGKESAPWGSKITQMVEHAGSLGSYTIHSIDYQDLTTAKQRIERLVNYAQELKGEIIFVGSSMGGYVSTVASNQIPITGLLLLAPAFYLKGYEVKEPNTPCKNTIIIHGWNDDIVPYQNSLKFAKQHKAKLVLVNDGHRLSQSEKELNQEIENIIKSTKKNE